MSGFRKPIRAFRFVIGLLAAVGVCRHAAAATYTWDAGGGADIAMSTSANWVGDPTVNFLTSGTNNLVFGTSGTIAQPSTNYSLDGITFTRGFTTGTAASGSTIGIGAGGLTLSAAVDGNVTFNWDVSLTADSVLQNNSNFDFVTPRGFIALSAVSIRNSGNGTNWLRTALGPRTNVTLIQDSLTSRTVLTVNTAVGMLEVRKGLLTWTTQGNPATGNLVLGSGTATGTDWATLGFRHQGLQFGSVGTATATMTVSQPIIMAGTAGINTIASGKTTYGSSFTPVYQTQIFTGGVTGSNSLYLENVVDQYGDDSLRFGTNSINMSGKLFHVGSGSGTATIDSVIGVNVTEVVQNSATSKLILNGVNLYAGNTTVQAGTLALGAAASIANSAAISVAAGATFDVSALTGGLTIAAGQSVGGAGSILGSLAFGADSKLAFDSSLTVNSGTVTFNGFGVADILGLDGTVVSEGTYTLLSGNATFDLTNALNVGAANAGDIGGGKSAYLQQGSLQVVVVPEPGTLVLASLGLAGLAAWIRGRRS